MKQSIMKKWVKALRSGRYKQGKDCLKSKSKRGVTRHCCLGVLCELYQKDEKTGKMKVDDIPNPENGSGTVYQFGSQKEMYGLPNSVSRWAGIKGSKNRLVTGTITPGEFKDTMGRRVFYESLAELNDAGCSFSKIADIIEAQSDTL